MYQFKIIKGWVHGGRERERNLISNLFRKVSRPSQAKICKWRFLLELSLVVNDGDGENRHICLR